MRGIFDEEELQPVQHGHDRELTLSSGMLLVIFFGLVVICGVCFGGGYAVGRRGLQAPDALQASDVTPASAETGPAKAKPSATTTTPVQAASTDAAAVAEANGALGAQPVSAPVGAAVVQAAVQPGVVATATQAPQAAVGATAVKPAGSMMVQIAAVTDMDDANVLMGALRKRGYAVTGQHDAGDGMIHVRIGPFTSKDEADKWRMKLLNDGYNAILQP